MASKNIAGFGIYSSANEAKRAVDAPGQRMCPLRPKPGKTGNACRVNSDATSLICGDGRPSRAGGRR